MDRFIEGSVCPRLRLHSGFDDLYKPAATQRDKIMLHRADRYLQFLGQINRGVVPAYSAYDFPNRTLLRGAGC